MAGMPSPTADPFVQAVLTGLMRSLAKPIIKKKPFTVDMVKSVIRNIDRYPVLGWQQCVQ